MSQGAEALFRCLGRPVLWWRLSPCCCLLIRTPELPLLPKPECMSALSTGFRKCRHRLPAQVLLREPTGPAAWLPDLSSVGRPMNQQPLPHAKAAGPYQAEMQGAGFWLQKLLNGHAELSKNGTLLLSRKVPKSSGREVWAVSREGSLWYHLLWCSCLSEGPAIRISLFAGSVKNFLFFFFWGALETK